VKRSLVVLLLTVLLCACSRNGAVIVGSKNFAEQLVLGEMAAQQIERKLHIPVDRRLGLGGTLLTHQAIVNGDIDIYPEYTGTAISVILKQKPSGDSSQVFSAVKSAYAEKYQLNWLPPLGFNNTFAMVVRMEAADKLREPTLSAAQLRSWRLGMGFEFLTRPDGLGRLDEVYKLNWNGLPKSMDLGLLYRALAQGEVDMVAAASTDAQLGEHAYQVLRDDRHAFPPYNACYVVRQSLIRDKPGIEQALGLLQGRIDDYTMRGLNRKVEIEHQRVETVVRDFLATQP
jgi:osmoprotectant transport system substrate-binding protein